MENKILRVIDKSQPCDMGDGIGHYELLKDIMLRDFLKYLKNTLKDWGKITITTADERIVRKFDYNLYDDDIFYCEPHPFENNFVAKATFTYCFMNVDIEIALSERRKMNF